MAKVIGREKLEELVGESVDVIFPDLSAEVSGVLVYNDYFDKYGINVSMVHHAEAGSIIFALLKSNTDLYFEGNNERIIVRDPETGKETRYKYMRICDFKF